MCTPVSLSRDAAMDSLSSAQVRFDFLVADFVDRLVL